MVTVVERVGEGRQIQNLLRSWMRRGETVCLRLRHQEHLLRVEILGKEELGEPMVLQYKDNSFIPKLRCQARPGV